MDVIQQKINYQKKIKWFLVFFCAFFIVSCQKEKGTQEFTVNYEGKSAVSILFEGNLDNHKYKVVLKDKETSILGTYISNNQHIKFTPIVPFSEGASYQIISDDQVLFDFLIKDFQAIESPKLTAIYPDIDTVPENLLKMYFVFSKPMQQLGKASKHITVFDKTENKKADIFLFLENELWNTNHTELTLWLDPGRIKKDLIPNKERGIPIKKDYTYVVTVSKEFTDENGQPLESDVSKEFTVTSRDEKKPSFRNWEITTPKPTTKEALGISFDESLDRMLIEDMIQVYTNDEKLVKGSFLTSKKGTFTLFIPQQSWKKGEYIIKIDSKLEDLTGNNLNRLFDTDLSKGEKLDTSSIKTIVFTVQEDFSTGIFQAK